MLKQKDIALEAGLSQPALANILSGRRRPSWAVAKRLAEATKTKPQLWLEGTPDQIRSALEKKGKR